MKIIQINGVCGVGSTGRIAQDISMLMTDLGFENYVFYGEGYSQYQKSYKIGSNLDLRVHQFLSRITDKHALYSKKATKALIKQIRTINPDVIHLHNLHGYYLNINLLFNYLKTTNYKIVWTLHDCWSFTGHCAYFDYAECNKWKIECEKCPNKKQYPKSWLIDRSKKNYKEKKILFSMELQMSIITPSDWLNNLVHESFLQNHDILTINNGIDLSKFKPTSSTFRIKNDLEDKFVILCIAVDFEKRKGSKFMIELAEILDDSFRMIVLGLNEKQMKLIPSNIIGIKKTNDIHELAELYSIADVYLNPTLEDNFPTTNLESLACGTPVITFNTGGSPEAIDESTGIVVYDKNIFALKEAVLKIKGNQKDYYSAACIERANKNYDKNNAYLKYLNLYKSKYNGDIR